MLYNVLFHAGRNSTLSWQSKVIGGARDGRKFSILASIETEALGQICTGYVISNLYILSAAFCIYSHTLNKNYDFVFVIVGRQERQIMFMEYYPSYLAEKNAFDVGLIRVSNLKTSEDIILFSMHF